eukprot:2440428-Pyramimonas_sp.AAC.1
MVGNHTLSRVSLGGKQAGRPSGSHDTQKRFVRTDAAHAHGNVNIGVDGSHVTLIEGWPAAAAVELALRAVLHD